MTLSKIIKRLVKFFFLILAVPLYLILIGFATIGDEDSTFHGLSQALSIIPGKFGIYLRAAFYRLACPDTSDEISIGFLTLISHRDTTIKQGVYIGPQCNIGKCLIEKNTLIGSGVHILSGNKQHNFRDISTPIKDQGGYFQKISIGNDCWVGNASVIVCSLPDRVIVASGAIVIDSPETGDILGGNPAKVIKNRLTKI